MGEREERTRKNRKIKGSSWKVDRYKREDGGGGVRNINAGKKESSIIKKEKRREKKMNIRKIQRQTNKGKDGERGEKSNAWRRKKKNFFPQGAVGSGKRE